MSTVPRPCDCGRDSLLGGYCSKQCELKAIICEQDETESTRRLPGRRGETMQSSRRVQDLQYHGESRADDV